MPDSPHDVPASVPAESCPSCAAVVVYFRTPALLQLSLDALRRQTLGLAEITVVDNSSAVDGLTEPPVGGQDWQWVRSGHNLGFGAACNAGARHTSSAHILFINADVILHEDACQRLLDTIVTHRDTAVVGPRIFGGDGRIELSARSFPSVRTALLGRSSIATQMLGRLGRAPSEVAPGLGPSGLVDWVSGACILVRRDAFEQVGGFDEGYWMYWEDADLCRRLRDLCWTTRLCAEAQARHLAGSSGRSKRTIEAFHSSAGRYYERHVARSAHSAAIARILLTARMRVALARGTRRSGSA